MFILYYVVFIFFYFAIYCLYFFFFFFSSRRRHTRCLSDWSSDVCSSDLPPPPSPDSRSSPTATRAARTTRTSRATARSSNPHIAASWTASWRRRASLRRSEERRVGKEWRSRGVGYY